MKIFRKKTSEKFAKRARISFVMAMIFGLSFQLASAWTDPNAPAPGGNVGAPLTTGNFDQKKEGDLKIGDVTHGIKSPEGKDGILDVADVWLRDADNGTGGKGAWASQIVSKQGYAPGFFEDHTPGTDSAPCKAFIVPDNVYSITVQIWGAGGGGAFGTVRYRDKLEDWYNIKLPFTNAHYSVGGSGGSGAYSKRNFVVAPKDRVVYCIGKGGNTSIGVSTTAATRNIFSNVLKSNIKLDDGFRFVNGFSTQEAALDTLHGTPLDTLAGKVGEAGDGGKTSVTVYVGSSSSQLGSFDANGGTGGSDGAVDAKNVEYDGSFTNTNNPIICGSGTAGVGGDQPAYGDENKPGFDGLKCDDRNNGSDNDYVGTGSSLVCSGSPFGPQSCTQIAAGGKAVYGTKRFDAGSYYAFGKGGDGSGLDFMPMKCGYHPYGMAGIDDSNWHELISIGGTKRYFGSMVPVTSAIPGVLEWQSYEPKSNNKVAGGFYYTGRTSSNHWFSVRCEPILSQGPTPPAEKGQDGAIVISWGEK